MEGSSKKQQKPPGGDVVCQEDTHMQTPKSMRIAGNLYEGVRKSLSTNGSQDHKDQNRDFVMVNHSFASKVIGSVWLPTHGGNALYMGIHGSWDNGALDPW